MRTNYLNLDCSGVFGFIGLWEGAAYDGIGQWIDEQVKSKIVEIINGLNP